MSAPQSKVHFLLHGFLGRPADFKLDPIRSLVSIAPDYFRLSGLGPENNFSTWATNFNRWAVEQAPNSERILVGYSLGARLALQALINNSKIWSSAILMSANPGLEKDNERQERIINDEKWAQAFLNEPWHDLMKKWNSQPVFARDSNPEPLRDEKNYHREKLALALQQWSLGKMPSAREYLCETRLPIHLLAGEKDQKFSSLLQDLKVSSSVQKTIVADEGHRLIFSAKNRWLSVY